MAVPLKLCNESAFGQMVFHDWGCHVCQIEQLLAPQRDAPKTLFKSDFLVIRSNDLQCSLWRLHCP